MECSSTELKSQSVTVGPFGDSIRAMNSPYIKAESMELSSEDSDTEFQIISDEEDAYSRIDCLVDIQPEYISSIASIQKNSSEHCSNGDSQNEFYKPFNSIEDVHRTIASEINRVEQNLSRMVVKRIHRIERKIVEFQKNMSSDILLLSKEQTANKKPINTVACSTKDFSCLPLNSVIEMLKFEDELKSDFAMQNNLISCLFAINCNSPGEYIRICWSKILTDEVATNFSWKRTQTKSSIYNRIITKVIKRAFEYKFPLNHEKFSNVTKKYFQYAPDRTCPLETEEIASLNKDVKTAIPTALGKLPTDNNATNQAPSLDLPFHARPSMYDSVSETLETLNNMVFPAAHIENTNGVLSPKCIVQQKKIHKSRKRFSKKRTPPKTGAERSREYRLRKKWQKMKALFEQMNENQPTIENSVSIPFNKNPNFDDLDWLHKINYNNMLNIPIKTEKTFDYSAISTLKNTAHETPSSKTTTSKKLKVELTNHSDTLSQSELWNHEYPTALLYEEPAFKSSPKTNTPQRSLVHRMQKFINEQKKIPKTPAERSRAYRMRKKLKQASAFQFSELVNECSLTSDPVSHDSSDAILNQMVFTTAIK